MLRLTFWITAPLTVVFVQKYFGRANLGVLTGIVIMIHQAAGGAGAYSGGAVYDAYGGYPNIFVGWLFSQLGLLVDLANPKERGDRFVLNHLVTILFNRRNVEDLSIRMISRVNRFMEGVTCPDQ
ncbi:MAG: hypothetical protein CM1200mP18_04740 [Gammaproteobacteria bacterium]|nr:MAG: hypothetical protein CM1200mP18_04740 [Gammaproteobacteria bacterium]